MPLPHEGIIPSAFEPTSPARVPSFFASPRCRPISSASFVLLCHFAYDQLWTPPSKTPFHPGIRPHSSPSMSPPVRPVHHPIYMCRPLTNTPSFPFYRCPSFPPYPPFSGNSSALEHSCNLDTPLAHSIPLHLFYPLPLSYISVSCISLLAMPPCLASSSSPPLPAPPEPLGPSTRALFFLRVWQDNKEEQQE